jgi:hypothetical protein
VNAAPTVAAPVEPVRATEVPPTGHAPAVDPAAEAIGHPAVHTSAPIALEPNPPAGFTTRPQPGTPTGQDRETLAVPEPASPAGGTSAPSSGVSAAPSPAPPGAVAYLFAAFSLAAALLFARLLAAPADLRPVLFVSAIERPG